MISMTGNRSASPVFSDVTRPRTVKVAGTDVVTTDVVVLVVVATLVVVVD
jgi:hypothetical protein